MTGTVFFLLLVGFVVLVFLFRDEMYEQIDVNLSNTMQTLCVEVEEYIDDANWSSICDEVRELESAGILSHFWEVRKSKGHMICGSDFEGVNSSEFSAKVNVDKYHSFYLKNGKHIRTLTKRIPLKSETFLITIGADQEEFDEAMARFLIIAIITVILILFLTLILISLILKRGLRPLSAFGNHIASIEVESLNDEFDMKHFPVELHPFGNHFNTLLKRLAASFERERRINADIAHELRTPIAELRLSAETALKWPKSRDGMVDRETLAIAKQMESTVEHMLALARSEGGNLVSIPEEIQLDLLIKDCWKPFSQRSLQLQQIISVESSDLTLETDPYLLQSILRNLFENAVCYTPKGGTINISTFYNPTGELSISVTNTVSDLTTEDVEHVFERYWRKEASRAPEGNHLGLGLAIVKTFSQANGFEAKALIPQSGWFSIVLTAIRK